MEIIKSLFSSDKKVAKFLQATEEGHIIETGHYDLEEHIVCISSQIDCPMGCIFCVSTTPIDQLNTNKHSIRNLTSTEIVSQVCNVLSLINQNDLKSKEILFSYMGIGEPFLNYQNVLESIKNLSKRFPKSRTTISTLGIRPDLMKKMAHLKLNNVLKLHLSLHAPNDKLRKKILPKAQEIQPALQALEYFSSLRKVLAKVNYVLIKDLNDSEDHANQLAELLRPYPFIVKLSNLNKFNNLLPSSENRFNLFEKILNSKGVETCRFSSAGTDISAGCGQFKKHSKNQ